MSQFLLFWRSCIIIQILSFWYDANASVSYSSFCKILNNSTANCSLPICRKLLHNPSIMVQSLPVIYYLCVEICGSRLKNITLPSNSESVAMLYLLL